MDHRKVIDRLALRLAESMTALSEAESVLESLQIENRALKSSHERMERELKQFKDVGRGIYAGEA